MSDTAAELVLAPRLSPGERLLWSGRPRQGVFLRGSDALLIPFTLMWAGFACFWEFMALRAHAPLFFALWGIPFLAVGGFILIGRFFADAWVRARTYYGVTGQRALVYVDVFGGRTTSLDLHATGQVDLAEFAGGRGTITFGAPPWAGYGMFPGYRTRAMVPQFDQIDDARQVYEMVRAAQQQTRDPITSR